ncbi:MAG: orotidine 5'-phosphate decarboxylase [Chloroflexi bacterium RBG_16_64_32]|nr:MAG: orotidine 5'-phosphate decarboxylase [Chloroflexi bacterium RBG_16_64_32]
MRRQRRWASTGTTFRDKLIEVSRRNQSLLCVGLDPDPSLLRGTPVVTFLQAIIEATQDIVCAYKPNLAFFEAMGTGGMLTLMEALRGVPVHVPVIADAKRSDIASTSRFYARALFEEYDFDAATVNPYLGGDSVEPFLEYGDKGVFVLCRTSNPGAEDIQNLRLSDGRPLFEAVAELANRWNTQGNVGLVVGATWPAELERIRAICPELPILLPGVGAQGADLGSAMGAGLDAEGGGVIISSSRQVLYASSGDDFAEAARKVALGLRDEMNRQRDALLAQR